jgi:GT2 family glycosyltransferase
MDVSIIMPVHSPDERIMKKIDMALKGQKFNGKLEIIKVERGLGLADSLNWGISNSKYEIVVSLHQDSIPSSENWLQELVEPIKDNNVVASVSRVELPEEFWRGFEFFGKLMSAKEVGEIIPLLDEKGCAYKKKILKGIGLFNGRDFRTSGEDFDMYIKLKKIGKIVYPKNAKVFHFHEHTFKKRIKKEIQLSEGFGALVRIYGSDKIPSGRIGFIKSIPLLGWPIFLFKFPYKKVGIIGSGVWIFLSLEINLMYSIGFWKGFIQRRQRL